MTDDGTTTTVCTGGASIVPGDVVMVDGLDLVKVTKVDSATTLTFRQLRWYEKLWVRAMKPLRRFWWWLRQDEH